MSSNDDDDAVLKQKGAQPTKPMIKFMAFRKELRKKLVSAGLIERLPLGPEPEYAYLSRFIIARNGKVDECVKQIKEHIEWAEKTNIGKIYEHSAAQILNYKCFSNDIDANYPLYIRGKDRWGHPVVYAKAGKINAKKIMKVVTNIDQFILYHSWLRERMMRMRDIQLEPWSDSDRDYNPCKAQYTVVVDFEGVYLSQVNSTFWDVLKRVSHIDQVFYPERMFRLVCIHTPFIFTAVYKIAKTFLDKDTVAKFRITRSDYSKYLQEIIHPSELPSTYGGTQPPLDMRDLICNVTEEFFGQLSAQKEPSTTVISENITEVPEDADALDLLKITDTSESCKQNSNIDDNVIEAARALTLEQDEVQFSGENETTDLAADIATLQEILVKEHLKFEQLERCSMKENQRIRSNTRRLRKNTSIAQEKPSPYHLRRHNNEIQSLENEVAQLSKKLERILEEISSHQRAVTFARKFIEGEISKTNDDHYVALQKEVDWLTRWNTILSEDLDRSFGPGSSDLFLASSPSSKP